MFGCMYGVGVMYVSLCFGGCGCVVCVDSMSTNVCCVAGVLVMLVVSVVICVRS